MMAVTGPPAGVAFVAPMMLTTMVSLPSSSESGVAVRVMEPLWLPAGMVMTVFERA